MKWLRIILASGIVLMGLPANGQETSTLRQPIVNGTLDPQVIALPGRAAGHRLDLATEHRKRPLYRDPDHLTSCDHRETLYGRYRYDEMSFGLGREPTESRVVFDLSRKIEHPTEDVASLILSTDAVDTLNEINREWASKIPSRQFL